MNINEMDLEQVETRMNEVKSMLHEDGADLDALEAEINELKTRKATVLAEIETRKAEINEVIESAAEITPIEERSKKMETIEVRNTKEYIDAYANYIKTGSDKACRALLSENASAEALESNTGTVPVPEVVYDIIKTAWDNNEITSLVRKTYIKGNLKVGFEASADPASVHPEGAEEPNEEELTLGIVNLIPESIKKWITISDEAIDLGGEQFLRYIYDELTYQIAKKAASEILGRIIAAPETSSATAPAVPQINVQSLSVGLVAQALAFLSDEAVNPVIVMHKQTWAAFKAVEYGSQYAVDPFEGLRVVFCNELPTFASANPTVPFMIIGDFGHGVIANFPNGEEITIKYDDLSLAEKDLVKVVGREYVGLGVVAPNAFVKVKYGSNE